MSDSHVKILMIEDNPGDARLIQEILSENEELNFELVSCSNLNEGIDQYRCGNYDLVLLDLSLPDSSGLETIIKANECISDVPIIVLTGNDDECSALEAVKQGAQDYLVKGHVGSNTLTRCIRYSLERHRMRAELAKQAKLVQASEANLRNIIEQNADGMIVLDENDKIIFINPAAEKLLGRSRSEIVGEQFGFPAIVGESVELDLVRPDKKAVIVEIRVSVTEWQGSESKLISLRDITFRKRTEEALQILSNRNQALLEAIPDIIMEVDVEKRYTWANDAGYRFFGNDVLGHRAEYFFRGEQDTLDQVAPLFSGDIETCFLESWQFNQHNEKRLLAWWCRSLRNERNEVIGALSSARDITEKKMAENLIRSREAILSAVSFAAERLITENAWQECIQDVLQELGQAAGVSRTYIFENYIDENSLLRTSQKFEWVAEGVESHLNNPYLIDAFFNEPGFRLLLDTVALNKFFKCHVKLLPEEDRKFLQSQDIKSLIVMPIFVHGNWWGFLGFDECERQRDWSQVEVEAIRAGADILAAAIHRNISEKKLVDSEKRFRDISENTSDLIWEMDKTGRFVYINKIVGNILGFEPGEVIGKHFWDFAVPSDSENIKAFFEHVLNHKAPIRDLEAKYVHKNGTAVYMEMNGIPVYDSNENFKTYRGVSRDITERKLKEAEQQKENQYELNLEKCIARGSSNLLKSKDLGTAITNTLKQVTATMEVCRAYYFQKENVEYSNLVSKVWSLRDKKECTKLLDDINLNVFKNWALLLSDNIVLKIDNVENYSIQVPEEKQLFNRFKIKSFIAVPIFVQGVFYGMLGCDETRSARHWKMKEVAALRTIAENISRSIERQRANELMKYQKIKFESVVRNSTEGIILIDEDFQINLINPAGRKMLRHIVTLLRSRQKLKRLGEIEISDIWDEFLSTRCDSLKREVIAINRTRRFFNATFSAVKNVSQRLTGIVINLSDVTESRQTQEQLVQSSKLASIGQLAAGVAHELNNPLTSILGFAQLALKSELSSDLHDSFSKILIDGKRAKNIVKTMLEFSHKANSTLEKGNINETINSSLALMGKQLEVNDIKLVCYFDNNLSLAYFDKGQLQQVFLNLIQNAFDAMLSGGVGDHLEIRTRNVEDETIRIEFKDNGPGMTEEIQQRIFDPFFTTKDPGAGTGLGLSISYKIIQKHGGKLSVNSAIGKGTCFTIDLPTHLEEMKDSEPDVVTTMAIDIKGKIIVLDDGQDKKNVCELLAKAGHQVDESPDIADSLQKFAQDDYDLFFIDLKKMNLIKQSMLHDLRREWKNRVVFIADFSIGSTVKQKFTREGILVISKEASPREILHVVTLALKMRIPVTVADN